MSVSVSKSNSDSKSNPVAPNSSKHSQSSGKVYIFDSTLRDGQQCPGAGMTFEDNLAYARLAAALKIDVLEAGFPSASKQDFEIVQAIAQELPQSSFSPVICGLCQLREEQVRITIDALSPAVKYKKARLHVYLPVDPELMVASLGSLAEDKPLILKQLFDFCKIATAAGLEVEFSPEGYSRMDSPSGISNFDFTTDLIRAAVSAGAKVINCPDTIGGASKLQGSEYFVEKMKSHAAIINREFPHNEVIWSMHCHNDFGLAVENSIYGVFNGPARQIEGCINGVGERAGNAALEQIIMVIDQFGRTQGRELYTDIELGKLQEVSDFIARRMLPRQPHWPVTGDSAAKHSSGGHTNAILKNPLAYQPFDPRKIGKEITFLFGPLSGGNHAKMIVEEQGYICEESEKRDVAQYIKDYYQDRRKGVTDAELILAYKSYRFPIKVQNFQYTRSLQGCEIECEGKFFGEETQIKKLYEGEDSAFAALFGEIEKKIPGIKIQNLKMESKNEGIQAVGVAKVTLQDSQGNIFHGQGEDRDTQISTLKALVDATNQLYVENNYRRISSSKTVAL